MTDSPSLSGSIAVVTGASRGLGYAIARCLASEGAHIVAIARTVGGLEELHDAIKAEGGAATLVPVDLKDFEAIDRLGAALYERFGKVDVVVGNAGSLGAITPVAHMKPSVFDDVFAINVTANYRLIRSMDPLLRQSKHGRSVFVTASDLAATPRAFWGPYAASKAALEAMVKSYAAEMAKTNVRANLFDPGPVRTALRGKAIPGENQAALPSPADVAPQILPLCQPDFGQSGVIVRAQAVDVSTNQAMH